jgi:hypothetical protein
MSLSLLKWAAGAPDPGIARTVPWRTFRWRHGQQHYSGTYWSSVMSGHVIYKSRLELTRLLTPNSIPVQQEPPD